LKILRIARGSGESRAPRAALMQRPFVQRKRVGKISEYRRS